MGKKRLVEPKASLYPVPVTLVTCSEGSDTNVITISWTGILCSKPPVIYISVRPERYSYHLLEHSGKFCINIPSRELLNKVDFCGNKTGASISKWKECNFNLIELEKEYPKAIKECKHHLLCDVMQMIELGTHTAFIAVVKHEFIDDKLVEGDHVFSFDMIQPIAYCRKKYYAIGEELGCYGYTNIKERIIMETEQVVTIVYTNYKGKTGVRQIIPKSILFGHNEWHTEDQWLMNAYDLDKGAERTFAMKDIKAWYTV